MGVGVGEGACGARMIVVKVEVMKQTVSTAVVVAATVVSSAKRVKRRERFARVW